MNKEDDLVFLSEHKTFAIISKWGNVKDSLEAVPESNSVKKVIRTANKKKERNKRLKNRTKAEEMETTAEAMDIETTAEAEEMVVPLRRSGRLKKKDTGN